MVSKWVAMSFLKMKRKQEIMEPQGITGCRLFLREVEDSGDGYLHMNLRPFIQGANNALLSLPLAAFSLWILFIGRVKIKGD